MSLWFTVVNAGPKTLITLLTAQTAERPYTLLVKSTLEVNESIADLGQQYMQIQDELNDKWQEWNDLFLD